MATLRKEIPVVGGASPVWHALRDFGQVHTKVAPGFLTDLKMDVTSRSRATRPLKKVTMRSPRPAS